MAELEGRCVNLRDDALRALRQMNGFTTPVVRCVLSRDPMFVFQSMQQCDQRRLFNPEMRGNFGLRQWPGRNRKMKQRPPFGLAQPHRLEPLVQFQPPRAGGAVQERTEYIDILVQSKLVSMLTKFELRAVSMPPTHSILSNKIDSFR